MRPYTIYEIKASSIQYVDQNGIISFATLLLGALRDIPIFAAPPQWHPHCTMAPTCQRLLMSVAATAMCGIASGLPSLELQTNAITLFPYTV